jgi:hypothetical protein
MMIFLLVLTLLGYCQGHTHGGGASVPDEVHGYLTLSSDLKLHYTLDNEEKTVLFELTATKNVWIAFGVGEGSGGMIGSDVVIGSGSGIVQR